MPNLSYLSHDAIVAFWGPNLTLGLLASAPEPDGSQIVEPAAELGYERQPITFSATKAAGITSLTSNGPLAFGPALNDWVQVNYFAVFDAQARMMVYGRLRTSRACEAGKGIIIPQDHIQIRLR
ncbi:hypothetical protein GURKE_04080 [Brevundimonas phage vB_BpoS-Gurke]|uniref:Uncharacterized protein n=1 Tax=Brevundimonas phage vB_BpoS-Gurke TaxID=2948599 RepID=A0A9E7N3M6_9CAUD|nr:hypothetical protein GURKE_04080 [Brevundimonas phage vB_BpoS-Gurke]